MFGNLGRGTYLDVLSVGVLTLIVTIPTLIWKHFTKLNPWKKQRKELVILIVLLVLWLAASIFLVVGTKGVCVCFYNNKYGFKIDADVEVSS
jgi:heme/copper-type cytochrome/quinol oxidase subunit 2